MSAPYERLGIQRTWSRLPLDAPANPQRRFEQQLLDIESGSATLNLSPDSIHLAAEIAAFDPHLDGEQRIALVLLIVISLAALQEGSTRFPVTGPESVEPIRGLLNPLCGQSFGGDGVERMRIAIQRILSSGSATGVIGASANDYKPLIYLPPFIYQHRILSAEIALASRLATLINASSAAKVDSLMELTTHFETIGGRHIELSAEQRAAIECAVRAPLTIISGGPGTGKTSIVLAILKVLVGAGVALSDVAMAAPTGKAAYRIGESIRENLAGAPNDVGLWKSCQEPTTIHRLLGYSPTRRRFRYHRNNPLEAQVVIIDEGSMLDLELMSRLLDALRPDARLIILGDADQLPSVSAGAVFRDLVPPAEESDSMLARKCVRLTRSYRMNSEEAGGGAVFNLSRAINVGLTDLFAPAEIVIRRDAAEDLEFIGAEWLEAQSASGAFLERWYLERIRADQMLDDLKARTFNAAESGFAPIECESLRSVLDRAARSRILCITRVLDSGSERINALLHRRVAYANGVSPDRDRFIAGEPVMMLRNDYERMLFNGDQGLVLRVRRPGYETALMAVFPRGDNFVAFRIDALKEHLEMCYAMTVHKAQGSEFDSVAVIMPEKDIPILTREIIYTAVSRARSSVTIIGSTDVIRAGLSRRIARYSGLRDQLAKCLDESQRA